jgi:chemotaxis signal transduction protein
VVFRLGAENYGVSVEAVSGVIRYEMSTPVPRSPESVMGVINLRGRIIPVVDLSFRFTHKEFVPGPQSRIVVTETISGLVGIAVDEASEVAEFSADEVHPVPEGVLSAVTSKAFVGVVERAGALIIVLDIEEAVPLGARAALTVDTEREGRQLGA